MQDLFNATKYLTVKLLKLNSMFFPSFPSHRLIIHTIQDKKWLTQHDKYYIFITFLIHEIILLPSLQRYQSDVNAASVTCNKMHRLPYSTRNFHLFSSLSGVYNIQSGFYLTDCFHNARKYTIPISIRLNVGVYLQVVALG